MAYMEPLLIGGIVMIRHSLYNLLSRKEIQEIEMAVTFVGPARPSCIRNHVMQLYKSLVTHSLNQT